MRLSQEHWWTIQLMQFHTKQYEAWKLATKGKFSFPPIPHPPFHSEGHHRDVRAFKFLQKKGLLTFWRERLEPMFGGHLVIYYDLTDLGRAIEIPEQHRLQNLIWPPEK